MYNTFLMKLTNKSYEFPQIHRYKTHEVRYSGTTYVCFTIPNGKFLTIQKEWLQKNNIVLYDIDFRPIES